MVQDRARSEHSQADLLSVAKTSPDATSDWAPGPATVNPVLLPKEALAGPAAVVRPAVPSLQKELETLLRWRLRWLTLLCSIVSLAILPLMPLWRPLLADPVRFATQGPLLLRCFVFTAVFPYPSLLLILWSRRRLSVRALRLIEWVFIGTAVAILGIDLHAVLKHLFHTPMEAGMRSIRQPVITGQATHWAITLVMYGLFIPNSWRRCVIVVSVMALSPFFVVAWFCLEPGFDPAWSPEILKDVAWLVIGVAMGAVMAIYATHKLTTLREVQQAARRLGQYRLQRRLGAGGMGEVYLGEHRLLKRPCAVKLIRPEKAGDSAMLQRFEREVQAMTRLTHWNVVEVFDYGRTDDGTLYYVMEYLPGLTLEELVKRHGPLPPGRAVYLLRQVCAALREAHAKGLIHRDLKPGNVIVGERGGVYDVAKLLDFGLVQGPDLGGSAEKLTQHGTFVGTPAYLSPEQARGGSEVGPASDIYSLGALGYYLLTGQPPFLRPSAVQTITAHLTDIAIPPSKLRPEIPADLEQVILTCLEKSQGRRFPDGGRVEQALASCTCAGAWSEAAAGRWWQEQTAEPQAVADQAGSALVARLS